MAWFARFFRRKGFWGSLALILVLAVVGTVGIAIEASLTLILAVLIVILLIVVAILAVRVSRASRASTGIEAGIRAQAERDLVAATPDHRADVERMQERLEKAIAQLKQSKLAGEGIFRSGKRALYALPWYIFIGPPGAGKTTALLHSGLRFPSGTEGLRGVGGTRNCDWFLSDQGILLDTAGRYTTEEQDHDEWLAFLEILKKHRPDRPINGVLVGISVPELLEAPTDELDWHAETIRKRIDELIEQLGVRFPVYIVFTKVDLVQGFVEFFGELARQEREQVWGCTFEPGEVDGETVRDAFRREFERLHEALLAQRNERLRRSMKREERHRVFTFPMEFAAARDPLARFLDGLFRPNPFHEEPVFRGFYFTSGTQEGLPIDRVIQAIAERLELPSQLGAPPEPQLETKSYFLTDVFRRVVIPDRQMVRPTGRSMKRARLATTGMGLAAVVLLGLFVLVGSQAMVRSTMDLNRMEATAVEAAALDWRSPTGVSRQLAQLDDLRREVERFEGGRPVFQLGLDRRGTVLEPAQRVYYGQARAFVDRNALELIRQSLRTGGDRTAGGFETALGLEATEPPGNAEQRHTLNRQRVYDDLKAYLLVTDEVDRLRRERPQQEFLKVHLGAIAQRTVVGPDTTGRGELAQLVARQSEGYVRGLVRGTARPFQSDAGLVARARELVYEPPSVAGLYNRIKQDALFSLDPLALSDMMPGRFLALFAEGPEVLGVFTRAGWEQVVAPAIESASEDPDRDDWVMGRAGAELPAAMQNPEEIRRELENRYFTEYTQAWERFLRSVRYSSVGDMSSAARRFADLSSTSESPLLWLLSVTTEQTTFTTGAGRGDLGDAASGVADRLSGRLRAQTDARTGGLGTAAGMGRRPGAGREDVAAMHPVERAFVGLHALNAPDAPGGGAAPELYAALEAMAQLAGTLEGLAGDQAEAANFAAQVLQQNGGPLAQVLTSVEGGTRRLDAEVRRTLFVEPVRQAWGLILGAAQAHLDRRWREEVYDPFRATLEGRFPLDPGSASDAPLREFEQFFAPAGGVVASFVEQALGPFMSSDGHSARSWQGRGIRLSSAAERAITQGRRIGDGLFIGGTMQFNFEMQADIPERQGEAPPPDLVHARIHGTSDSYRMGSRSWQSYSWPGTPGAMVSVSTREGELPARRYEGDWAIFRLLQDAEVRRAGGNQYTARWAFRHAGYSLIVRYDLRARSATGPFADPAGFFRFACPPGLS